MTISPLENVSPQSLAELFNEDPEGFDETKIERICLELRKDRERFAAEPIKRPKAASTATSKAKKTAATATLSLADLGDLDL